MAGRARAVRRPRPDEASIPHAHTDAENTQHIKKWWSNRHSIPEGWTYAAKDPEDSDDTHVEHEIDGDVHLFLNPAKD